MRRATRPGVLLCGLVAVLAACGGDTPTSTAYQSLAEVRVHPRGVVDRVDAPVPWGVAVRDDGLTLFIATLPQSPGTRILSATPLPEPESRRSE